MSYEPLKYGKRAVIFDTDIGPDCDDAGALALLAYYAGKYGVRLLGAVNCTSNPYANGAIKAIGEFCGLGEFPIGQYGKDGFLADGTSYNKPVSEKYCGKTVEAMSECEFYSEALSKAEDKSVTVIAVGPLSSVAEAIRNDSELFNRKVHSIVIMGGISPSGTEYNIRCMPEAASAVLDQFKGTIVFCGFEVGEGVLTGFSEEKENSPVFDSYKFWTGRKEVPYLRDSWDLCTVHYAFEGNCEFYDLSDPISVEIDCDGKNTFTPCTQSDRYCVVQKSSNEEIAEYINRILNA
ncbi:MAG: nucleoside hydrolase [Clostridiaceae bacterium]|nr:nucleoside hydrolase [Clostridiaceae bacterium]